MAYVQLDRPARECGGLGVEAVADAQLGERGEELRGRRAALEGAPLRRGESVGIPLQEACAGEHGERRQRRRVLLERRLGLRDGLVVALAGHELLGQVDPRRHVTWVDLETLPRPSERPPLPDEVERTRHAQKRRGMSRVEGQRPLELGAGVRAVVLLQEQVADLDASGEVAGVPVERLVERAQRVLVKLRVARSQPAARAADCDQLVCAQQVARVVRLDQVSVPGLGGGVVTSPPAQVGEIHPRGQRIGRTAVDRPLEGFLGFRQAALHHEQLAEPVGQLRGARVGALERPRRPLGFADAAQPFECSRGIPIAGWRPRVRCRFRRRQRLVVATRAQQQLRS